MLKYFILALLNMNVSNFVAMVSLEVVVWMPHTPFLFGEPDSPTVRCGDVTPKVLNAGSAIGDGAMHCGR